MHRPAELNQEELIKEDSKFVAANGAVSVASRNM
jgi:hypothetical protein